MVWVTFYESSGAANEAIVRIKGSFFQIGKTPSGFICLCTEVQGQDLWGR